MIPAEAEGSSLASSSVPQTYNSPNFISLGKFKKERGGGGMTPLSNYQNSSLAVLNEDCTLDPC